MAADDKDKRFAPGPPSSYPTHLTSEKITIAAVPYTSEEQVKSAFGKVNPNKEGILPVLVIIQNDTGKAVRLNLSVEYIDAGKRHADAIPPAEVPFVGSGPQRPRMPGTSPIPNPLPRRTPKRKELDTPEIEGRAFAAKMVPAGETVNGFFYFHVRHTPGSKLYLNGIRDAATNREFFFFEIPLDAPERTQ
jgi:hypothetical protein